MMRLLLIEDNVALIWRLREQLGKYFEVRAIRTASEGLHLAQTGRYSIIILDLSLPDMSGKEVCTALRQNNIWTPILILTADSTLSTKINLFDSGADDYLTKPFEIAELLARIRALQRRPQTKAPEQLLKVSDLTIDPERRQVARNGTSISLRRKEFDILEYLARNRGKIITQAMILNHVWGEFEKEMWSSTVRVHMKHLRDKVDRPFAVPLIKTARGVGYVLESN